VNEIQPVDEEEQMQKHQKEAQDKPQAGSSGRGIVISGMPQGRNSNIHALSHLPKDCKIMGHQTQRQHSTGCADAIIYRYFVAAGGTDWPFLSMTLQQTNQTELPCWYNNADHNAFSFLSSTEGTWPERWTLKLQFQAWTLLDYILQWH